MFPKRLEEIISNTTQNGIRHFSYDNKRPYFGLRAALTLYDSLIQEEPDRSSKEQVVAVGRAAVACAMVRDRDSQEYFPLKRRVKDMRQATKKRREVTEEQVEQVLLRAQRVEERTREERLRKLIEKHDLREKTICGIKLYLPDTQPYKEMISSEKEQEEDCFLESFSWEPLQTWCSFVERTTYHRRGEIIKEPTNILKYIEQITERYLSMNQAKKTMMYFTSQERDSIEGVDVKALDELEL